MSYTEIALCLIVIILIIYWWGGGRSTAEGYASCGCEGHVDLKRNAVLNPFIYPFSAEPNPDVNNAQAELQSLQTLSVPDHVPKVA